MGLFRGVESLRNDVADGSEAMALRVLESCDATGCGPTEKHFEPLHRFLMENECFPVETGGPRVETIESRLC